MKKKKWNFADKDNRLSFFFLFRSLGVDSCRRGLVTHGRQLYKLYIYTYFLYLSIVHVQLRLGRKKQKKQNSVMCLSRSGYSVTQHVLSVVQLIPGHVREYGGRERDGFQKEKPGILSSSSPPWFFFLSLSFAVCFDFLFRPVLLDVSTTSFVSLMHAPHRHQHDGRRKPTATCVCVYIFSCCWLQWVQKSREDR